MGVPPPPQCCYVEQGTCKLSQTSVGLNIEEGSEGNFRRGDWREFPEEGVRANFSEEGCRREFSEEGIRGKFPKRGSEVNVRSGGRREVSQLCRQVPKSGSHACEFWLQPEAKDLGDNQLWLGQHFGNTTILIPAYGSPGGALF